MLTYVCTGSGRRDRFCRAVQTAVECVDRSVKRFSLTCLSRRKDFAESGQEAENDLFEDGSVQLYDLNVVNNFASRRVQREHFFTEPCLVGKKTWLLSFPLYPPGSI